MTQSNSIPYAKTNPFLKPNWTIAEVQAWFARCSDPAVQQYATLVTAYLANEREEEPTIAEVMFHFDLGDDAEDAAQFIAEQRWAKSEAA